LGEAKTAQVRIRWPSGIVQTLDDVGCDKELQIDEAVPNAVRKEHSDVKP
jgi:hypothetical protein